MFKNDRPGDDGTLQRVIFGSIVKNHRIIIIIIIIFSVLYCDLVVGCLLSYLSKRPGS